ncbi:MAG: glycoside hydrolase family 15 protein [Candidatus Aramenus sulfurataquae]|jgi:GH15 family glucan-1,4-alpha-glucosidase|uniref:Glucan 1,3-alpha-glucosidase n=2 Tax=Candidatus Aramenus sulfurataquae TaxID=1326980 RepID=A0A0F2LRV2_9CREN|nr:glycoside hydrolase family 15 protein [Candidatus Aramenus sulfurataquae]
MTRYVILGNGQLTVLADKDYVLRELYYPLPTDNHLVFSKVGLWYKGKFAWLDQLNPRISYESDALTAVIEAQFDDLKVKIRDAVDMAYPILVREVTLTQEATVFFAWNFNVYNNNIGDTAFYDPFTDSMVHYKRDRWFMFSCNLHTYQYATGYKEIGGLQGTWKDCEDGALSMNPIAQGSVDFAVSFKANGTFFCWLVASNNYENARRLSEYVGRKTPKELMGRTNNYWRAWLFKARDLEEVARRSLLIIAAHWQNNGSIPAALDTDIMRFNRDTYNYVWHRDAAFASIAMSLAGYQDFSRNLFNFSKSLLYRGFLFQKYTCDGHWGSTWHPWTSGYIPIQEDETALMLYAAWVHFYLFRDVDFIKSLYRPAIKAAADFLAGYRDEETGLPLPSYDLWEERLGVHFFTSAAVYAGLTAAAKFAEFFGDEEYRVKYSAAAEEVKKGLDKFFVGDHFARSLHDDKVDSSTLLGAMLALDPKDERVKVNRKKVEEVLNVNGGIARYEGDWYLKEDERPNAWFISTLWLAQHYAFEGNPEMGKKYLEWVLKNSLSTGVIPEQISPSGNYPSVSPLVWSHAELIRTIYYLKKGFNRFI